MKKSIVFIFLIVVLVGSWIVYRMYNKPHRDPLSESSISVTAIELFGNYETNETKANERFLDKVLEVSGQISEITTNQESFPVVILETKNPMFGVRVTMENPETPVKVGDVVKIKGICTGYLSDVIIVKGILVTN